MIVTLVGILTSCEHEQLPDQTIEQEQIYQVYNLIEDWKVLQGDTGSVKNITNSPSSFIINSSGRKLIQISQKVIVPDSGSYFLMGKVSAAIDHEYINISIEGSGTKKEIRYFDSIETCKKVLISFNVKQSDTIDIKVGMSSGRIKLDSFYVFKQEYFNDFIMATDLKNEIKELLRIDDFSASNFDNNIDKIVESINLTFLEPTRAESEKMVSFYRSDIFKNPSTSYLHTYANDDSVRYSYCQKSSLSADDILKLFEIHVRQVHWTENCLGFHQFPEYWNPFDQKWKIIDPFYGVRYVNAKGDYLNFEEVKEEIRSNEFSAENIKKINIGRMYYSEEEIMKGWKSGISVMVIN